jgi:hypothetical protein
MSAGFGEREPLGYLDPPFGTTSRLGCDGKAGRHMNAVAVNCRRL